MIACPRSDAGTAADVEPRIAIPIVKLAMSVMFPGNETIYEGTIVGLLASQRGRRIVLVRFAVENGPRQDDFRAPWFMKRPAVEEWAEVAQFPKALQQACFPRDGDSKSSSEMK